MFKMITKAGRLNRSTIYPCLILIIHQKVMDLNEEVSRKRRESHSRQAVRGLPFLAQKWWCVSIELIPLEKNIFWKLHSFRTFDRDRE